MASRALLLIWLALALGGLAAAPAARAQPLAAAIWGEPLPLSDPALSPVAVAPSLAVDEAGGVHVLWYSVTTRSEELGRGLTDALLYRGRSGGVWSTPEPLFFTDRPITSDTSSPLTSDAALRNPFFALEGALASAPDGKLHLIAGGRSLQQYVSAPWHDVVRLALLLPPVQLGEGEQGAIAAGPDGALHVMFAGVPRGAEAAGGGCGDCVEILYRRSDDGTLWTRPENLSRADGRDARPQIALDERGGVHLLWEHHGLEQAGAPAFLIYRRSTDGGQSWEAPAQLGAPGEASLHPAIGAAAGGRLLAVYGGAATASVFYQASHDGGATWSAPSLVPGVQSPDLAGAARRFSLAADSAGRLHLLMVGTQPASLSADPQLLHLVWDGQAWSAPSALASGGPAPRGPQLRVGRGNELHAVWTTGEAADDGGLRETVWYNSALVDAPALAPVPTFTPVPTVAPPEVTPTPPPPTATALPPEAREIATVEGPPRWEGESLPILFLACGPVLLLIGAVIWWASGRGRGG